VPRDEAPACARARACVGGSVSRLLPRHNCAQSPHPPPQKKQHVRAHLPRSAPSSAGCRSAMYVSDCAELLLYMASSAAEGAVALSLVVLKRTACWGVWAAAADRHHLTRRGGTRSSIVCALVPIVRCLSEQKVAGTQHCSPHLHSLRAARRPHTRSYVPRRQSKFGLQGDVAPGDIKLCCHTPETLITLHTA
jgi:hypothetical protein